MHPSLALKIAAGCSAFLGLFHVPFLFLGEKAARFFTAPRYVLTLMHENSPWLLLVVVIILAVFGLFTVYALSGAGIIRRLPGQRGVLLAIASLYTLRGLVLLPQVLLLMNHPGRIPPQAPLFSATALLIATFHWIGLRRHGAKTRAAS